jgi:23S rRNA pseudouridine1911/1915/1917 synthase
MALDIVYEDEDLIVLNKPAGLVVHPGAGHQEGTLVNALLAHCGASLSGIGGVKRPGIVHRLDKDTSGLLVVAKNDASHQALSGQFAAHGRDGRLDRRYLAVVWGSPDHSKGFVSAPLARSAVNRKKIAISSAASARAAVTHYKVLENFGDSVSLIECQLETGRTHQIRVHMAAIGHPVLGDPVYGKGFLSSSKKLPEGAQAALRHLNRQALHAATLSFIHPRSGNRLHFTAPLPSDMQRLLAALRELKPHPSRKIDVSEK